MVMSNNQSNNKQSINSQVTKHMAVIKQLKTGYFHKFKVKSQAVRVTKISDDVYRVFVEETHNESVKLSDIETTISALLETAQKKKDKRLLITAVSFWLDKPEEEIVNHYEEVDRLANGKCDDPIWPRVRYAIKTAAKQRNIKVTGYTPIGSHIIKFK